MTDFEALTQEIEAKAAALGLAVTWKFVPVSQSRNAESKFKADPEFKKNTGIAQRWFPTLNWRYSLTRNGREEFLSGDYMQGSGHCPAYKGSVKDLGGSNSVMRHEAILAECETGKTYLPRMSGPYGAKLPTPTFAELLYSLCSDSDVLNYGNFEEWAVNIGYDADSRKAEKIYRDCLETALKLRNTLGDKELYALTELTRDM